MQKNYLIAYLHAIPTIFRMTLEPLIEAIPGKQMLRIYDGQFKGATAFFRNRPLLNTLIPLLAKFETPKLRILFHAASIGAELYSFMVYWHLQNLDKKMELEVFATDISPAFLAYAKKAVYPKEIIESMTSEERAFFIATPDDTVTLQESLLRLVTFLPPQSFVERPPEHYDIIFCLNALTYVSEQQQAVAIDNMASACSHYLLLNCFHPDTIIADLQRNGLHPVTNHIETIHNCWSERINNEFKPLRGTPEYSWVIPSFSPIEGYEYKFCSIFSKQQVVDQNS
jgi:hypothetical protein